MKDQFEDKLRSRAEQFVKALQRSGIDAAIVENSFRQYSVKVSVSTAATNLGMVVISYSPKSDSFSMKNHELKDKSLSPGLQAAWQGQQQTFSEHSASLYEIYVDGSFINGSTGYGAVILKDGKVVDELFGAVDAAEVNGTRQIAGELVGAKEALKWCARHSVTEVSIYYDYLGIEKWATGEWKTNQSLTREYARFIRECPTRIHWHKVDSHTGNRWNDRADALAKKGAGSIQAAAVETDLVSELIQKTEGWIEFLM
ncbi:MAG: RNase H family protein, partial [Blastocatellia bacterium]